jgi:hypothetical protein
VSVPFTISDFLDVFRRYNEAVWPAQWILLLLALTAVIAALRARWLTRAPALVLAVLWLWTGVVYHFAFFRSINPAAVVFGALFIVQAVVFVWLSLRKPTIRFTVQRDIAGLLGGLLIVFALVIYPSLGWLAGHRYPAAPTFGLPCPTTVFTFGLLLWVQPALPRRVLIIPVLWSVVATVAAFQLGMVEDFSLPLAAVVASAVALRGERRVERLRPA